MEQVIEILTDNIMNSISGFSLSEQSHILNQLSITLSEESIIMMSKQLSEPVSPMGVNESLIGY